MELSSLERFNSTHQAFLDQLTESIGIVLHTIEAKHADRKPAQANRSHSRQSFRIARKSCRKPTWSWQKKARSNLAKDQFLAMLSHELRTPLTPVLASALALESEPALPQDVQEIATDDPPQRGVGSATD